MHRKSRVIKLDYSQSLAVIAAAASKALGPSYSGRQDTPLSSI